jgi:MFS transporter, putative metabolite:H+ symporter
VLFGVYTPELFQLRCGCAPTAFAIRSAAPATIVSPFIVIGLFQSYGIIGVLALMALLLVIQIIAVWGWGVEPRAKPLEVLELQGGAK